MPMSLKQKVRVYMHYRHTARNVAWSNSKDLILVDHLEEVLIRREGSRKAGSLHHGGQQAGGRAPKPAILLTPQAHAGQDVCRAP